MVVELKRFLTQCKEWQCGSAVKKLQLEVELTCFSLFFSNFDCSLCKNMHVVVTSFFTDISATLMYKSYGPVLTKVCDCQGLKENFVLRILVLFQCA